MKVYNPQNCTFIDKQYVDKIELHGDMHVQTQVVRDTPATSTPRSAAGTFRFEDIPLSDYSWLNMNWGLPEKQQEILLIRDELKEESARHPDVNKWKKEILHAVLYPRLKNKRISQMPRFRVAKIFFGDLPCLPNERNYNAFLEWVRTGVKEPIKG